jgi:flagellar motor switch protein FliN
MSFSASPLVPDQRSGDADGWGSVAEACVSAVTEAMPQIPTAAPLSTGTPIADPAQATLPDPAGAAVTAFISGGVEGTVLIVVGQELVDALAGTPFGALEPAKALKPALETIASALGGRLDGEPNATPAPDALEILGHGTRVIIPLTSEDGLSALVGLAITQVPAAPAPGTSSSASASGIEGGGGAFGAGGGGGGPTAAGAARSWGIEMLRDVEMEVTCELGRTRMTVRQLLALAPGDVVELDRLAGSPADLLVNGTLLARGEVVVVDESFGLRITEIVTRDAT